MEILRLLRYIIGHNAIPRISSGYRNIVCCMAKISILIVLLPQLLCIMVQGQLSSNNECGVTSYYTDDTNRKIANGEEPLPGQWPWLVALFILKPDQLVNEFYCTGSIVSTKHVITAARCLWTVDPDYLYVSLGQFTSRNSNAKGTINREVASYKIHPNSDANGNSADSDLAILRLKIPIEYGPLAKPICLWSGPTDLQNVVNKVGYVVGWGQDGNNRAVEEARITRVPIVSQEDCDRRQVTFTDITSDRTFCAGLQEENLCNVDRGSALMLYDDVRNHYVLRGIAARTTFSLLPCYVIYGRVERKRFTLPRNYVVYVDVAKYIPWIQEQISTT